MTIPKFRAWVKAEKIMLPVGEIDFDYEFAYLEEENGYRCERDFDEIELMQFTGLKDKNGKEIFEGDVLKTYNGELTKVVWNKELACWEAEFLVECKAEFLGYIAELSEVADVKGNRSCYEIVGNVWENKEFLEEIMGLAKKCDRCGAFHNNYNEKQNSKKINAIMTLNTDKYNKYFSNNKYNLCPNCERDFWKWLNYR